MGVGFSHYFEKKKKPELMLYFENWPFLSALCCPDQFSFLDGLIAFILQPQCGTDVPDDGFKRMR